MSGNNPNYYYPQNAVYPAGYAANWAAWGPDAAFSYPPPSTTSAYMRSPSTYSYSSAYSSPLNSPALSTSSTNPNGSSPNSGALASHGRNSDGQGLSGRSSSHNSSGHSYYNRQYHGNSYTQNRYGNRSSGNSYNHRNKDYATNPYSWQPRNNYNKRPNDNHDGSDHKGKQKAKKKKSLAETTPKQRDWSLEEAHKALEVEKEYNKVYKNHSLIIKFPDLEVNKDIVSKFNRNIENVHFQQPSTARFCFVTLKKDADADNVISELNKIKFGEGFLTAEYKKDREEEQVVSPEDIDPFTLYVGNLAQEVTKEDMTKTFPKCKRIDIGYAKKMKYTRYAFVSFRKIEDAVEAFKATRCTEMHSKSLIVRFRRLKGTVGMPGEPKQQNPPKSRNDELNKESDGNIHETPDLFFPTILGDPNYSPAYDEDLDGVDSKEHIFDNNFDSGICDEILNPHQKIKEEKSDEVVVKKEPVDPDTMDLAEGLTPTDNPESDYLSQLGKFPPPPPPPEEPEDIKPDIKNILPQQRSTIVAGDPNELLKKFKPRIEIKQEKKCDVPEVEGAGKDIEKSNSDKSSGGEKDKPSGKNDLLDPFSNVKVKKEPEGDIEYYERRDEETLDELEFNHMWHKNNLGIDGFT